MIQKEMSPTQNQAQPIDTYAGHFALYAPVFTRNIESMNKKALQRLLKLLVKYPIEDEQLQPLGKQEKDTFMMADKLLISKYMMYLHMLNESFQNEANLKEMQKEAGKFEDEK